MLKVSKVKNVLRTEMSLEDYDTINYMDIL